ncbi:MAG: hypothetical protein K2Z81_10795, partial [Cyanobacteria bacterium]|nr:hypothetical protein [Cyanobacteriota bacterium]
MGSDRRIPNPEAVIEPANTTPGGAASPSVESNTESGQGINSTDNQNQDTQSNSQLSFAPNDTTLYGQVATNEVYGQAAPEVYGQAPATTNEQLPASTDLDFRPATDSTNVGDTRTPANRRPELDFSTIPFNRNQTIDHRVAPQIELFEPGSLQIRDENGQVIADEDAANGRNPHGTIQRDPSNPAEIVSIQYPDGRVRNFTHTNGQLTGIETLETRNGVQSQTRLVKENGTWFAVVNGLRAALPGDVQLSRYGALSFQLDNGSEGRWRCERADGSMCIERTIASGARIAQNDDNTIQQVARTDGSRIECR